MTSREGPLLAHPMVTNPDRPLLIALSSVISYVFEGLLSIGVSVAVGAERRDRESSVLV